MVLIALRKKNGCWPRVGWVDFQYEWTVNKVSKPEEGRIESAISKKEKERERERERENDEFQKQTKDNFCDDAVMEKENLMLNLYERKTTIDSVFISVYEDWLPSAKRMLL